MIKKKYSSPLSKIFLSCTIYYQRLSMFIGKLVSSLPAVQYGALFYRYSESAKIDALIINHGNFDQVMEFTDEA